MKVEVEYLPKLDVTYNVAQAKNNSGGRIDLIPAANYNSGDYLHRLTAFDWFDFYENLEGQYIKFLKRNLKKMNYDYIFIDSHSGVSSYSGICNIQLPDINILVTTPNGQNFEGAYDLATQILEHPYTKANRKNPIVLPVLSKMAMVDGENTKRWTNLFIQKFDPIIQTLRGFDTYRYVGDTTLHYIVENAFGENLRIKEGAENIFSFTYAGKIASFCKFLMCISLET